MGRGRMGTGLRMGEFASFFTSNDSFPVHCFALEDSAV